MDYSQDELMHRLFEKQVQQQPQALAVRFEAETLTYEQLNRKANQLARYLIEAGVGPDQLVGICLERSLEMVVGLLGILKAGAAYVPLDPHYPPDRLSYMLEDAAPRVLLIQERLRSVVVGTNAKVVALDSEWSEIASREEGNLDAQAFGLRPHNLAYMIYTSGSTGKPKGAMNEHRGVVNRLQWMQDAYAMGPEDTVLQKTPFSFDVSVWEFFWTLMSGAALVVARPEGHKDPGYLRELIEETGVTRLHFVPSMLQSFLDQHRAGECASLRQVVCSGEELPASLQKQCFESLPHVQLSNLYGPTEAAVDVTVWECRREDDHPRVPIGRPISNVQMYILDTSGQPVPIGVTGEIYIGGVGVGRGYLNRPQLTAERFVADPFGGQPQARMYRTGDLGRWRADGVIEYLGRNDSQVKIRGFRIELGEIEAQLMRSEQVREAVVLAREDVPGDKRLVAYVIGREGAHPGAEELRAHLKGLLPEYMVPSAFVQLESLPLTPNGKLDRRGLPAPELGAYASREYEAAQGEVEEILAGIWQELLHVERVGRHDNFFELGGHSLLIVQMMERLRRVGLSAEVRRIFESATLGELAGALTSEGAGQFEVPPNRIPAGCERILPSMLSLVELEEGHIEQIVSGVPGGAGNVQDIYPLAPLQEGILFHHLLNEGGADTYVVPTLLSVASRETLEKLIAALQIVIDRHDVLRTGIQWEQLPRPVQVVYRQAKLPVQELQLDEGRDAQAQVREWLLPERQKLDLRQAPLMRLQVAADPHGPHWHVMLQMHHISCDNTSRQIVLTEMTHCLEKDSFELPTPVPYRDHVAQALAYTRAHDAEVFFRDKLGDIDEPTAPFGLVDVHANDRIAEEAHDELSLDLARRVRALSRRLGVSTATLFHAAWSLVLARTTGREDVVCGTVLLGRLQVNAGAQRILGLFINTLPLRLRLKEVSARELVEQTQRGIVELLAHEQASLAIAQRCSAIAGSAPLFTALLNYRHHVDKGAEWTGTEGIRLLGGLDRTHYPITVSVDDLGEGFGLTIQSDRPVDPQRLGRYLLAALESLASALESAPHTSALILSILPVAERIEVMDEFNATRAAFSQNKLVHELFEEQARLTPDAVAVVYRERSLTYAGINNEANRLARYLRSHGVGPDRVVAICVERGLEMIIGLMGILKAGGAYLPLDPNYPPERLQYMLTDASPQIVLTQKSLLPALPDIPAEVVLIDAVLAGTAKDAAVNLNSADFVLDPRNAVYVIYTSGSTGRPKGTVMSHGSMVNLVEWHAGLGSIRGKRVLQFAALSFDVAFQEVFSTLCLGGSLVLLDEWIRRDAQALTQFLNTNAVERLFVPPLLLQSLADYAHVSGSLPATLRDVITAGEQLRISPEIRDLFANLPACRIHNHYGPTETHVVTALTLSGTPDEWPSLPSIGRPIQNTQVYILDGQRRPVPVGVMGEVYVSGVAVARGYLDRPEMTAQRFVADPSGNGSPDRSYRTGDLGCWRADGTIEYMGRTDDQVKIRGYRIELGEIEAQLARHERIKETAVVVREDIPGEKRLVAYCTLRNGGSVSPEELSEHLGQLLPDYMAPSAFVVMQAFPLTPSGKLDRRVLPAPEGEAYTKRTYEAPQGETEEAIARIWRDLLQMEQLGREENFFDLGGHSLSAMQAVVRMRSSLSVEMPVSALFAHPTVRQLAAHVQHLSPTADSHDDESELQNLINTIESMSEDSARDLLEELTVKGMS